MPVSSMTIAGNLLFAPFLTVFLFLCTLLCTATVCHIPCGWVATASNWWYALWMRLLAQSSDAWLIYSHQLLVPVFVLVAVCGLLTMQARSLYQLQRVGVFVVLLIGAWVCGHYRKPMDLEPFTIPCAGSEVVVCMHEGTVTVTDHGALGRLGDAKSWIRYQLTGELIKRCGKPNIHTMIETVGSYRTYRALGQLCALLDVEFVQCPRLGSKAKNAGFYTACLELIAQKCETELKIL